MSKIDVSVILTLHREAKYVARTLASLRDAAGFARQRGITVELVAVLDRPDEATRQAWHTGNSGGFDDVQSIEVDNGSPGLSRNAGCNLAKGTLFDLLDGDDLISYTWIHRAHEAALQHGPAAILVPRFSFAFGSEYYSVEYLGQDSISTIGVVSANPYTVKICANRALFAGCRFADVRHSNGYAHEDWHFNTAAMALGYQFFAVDGTALFYRQRAQGRYRQSIQASTGQIPPSPLFRPRTFLATFAADADRLSVERPILRVEPNGSRILEDPLCREILARANAIDPAVEIGRYDWACRGWFINQLNDEAGLAYYRACEAVGDLPYDLVCLLPDQGQDGTPCPVARAMYSLAEQNPQARILALFDPPPGRDYAPLAVPGSAMLIDLQMLGSRLTADERDVLHLRLLQACAPTAPIHCSPSGFARRFFRRFGILLQDRHITCYRPPDAQRTWQGSTLTDPSGFEFVSENIDLIDRVIHFDQETMEADRCRLPGLDQKWHVATEAGNAAPFGEQHG